MCSRSAFEHSPRNLPSSSPPDNMSPALAKPKRLMPSLKRQLSTLNSQLLLWSENTEGNHVPIALAKPKRLVSSLNFQLSTLNSHLALLTSLFPPLTDYLPVSPLLATLTKNQGACRRCYVSYAPDCRQFCLAPRPFPHSNLSPHRLQSSFCPTCLGAHCEVSG